MLLAGVTVTCAVWPAAIVPLLGEMVAQTVFDPPIFSLMEALHETGTVLFAALRVSVTAGSLVSEDEPQLCSALVSFIESARCGTGVAVGWPGFGVGVGWPGCWLGAGVGAGKPLFSATEP